jgi:hypothetical protein
MTIGVLIGLHAVLLRYFPDGITLRPSGHPVQVRASNPTRAEGNRILIGAGPKLPAAAHEYDAHGTAWCAGRRGYCASALLVAFRVGDGCGGAVKQGSKSLSSKGTAGANTGQCDAWRASSYPPPQRQCPSRSVE